MHSKILTHAKRSHEGLSFIRTPVDEFQLKGPEGTHSCLVYVPMRETLFRFQHRLRRERLPLPVFKLFVYCLLEALDYLHTECRMVHTGKTQDAFIIMFIYTNHGRTRHQGRQYYDNY